MGARRVGQLVVALAQRPSGAVAAAAGIDDGDGDGKDSFLFAGKQSAGTPLFIPTPLLQLNSEPEYRLRWESITN
jgi:hypothetical protein